MAAHDDGMLSSFILGDCNDDEPTPRAAAACSEDKALAEAHAKLAAAQHSHRLAVLGQLARFGIKCVPCFLRQSGIRGHSPTEGLGQRVVVVDLRCGAGNRQSLRSGRLGWEAAVTTRSFKVRLFGKGRLRVGETSPALFTLRIQPSSRSCCSFAPL
jgi:hypothetical protein